MIVFILKGGLDLVDLYIYIFLFLGVDGVFDV